MGVYSMILVDYHKDGMYGCWIVDDSIPDEHNAIVGTSPSVIRNTPEDAVKWAEKMAESDELVNISDAVHEMIFGDLGRVE